MRGSSQLIYKLLLNFGGKKFFRIISTPKTPNKSGCNNTSLCSKSQLDWYITWRFFKMSIPLSGYSCVRSHNSYRIVGRANNKLLSIISKYITTVSILIWRVDSITLFIINLLDCVLLKPIWIKITWFRLFRGYELKPSILKVGYDFSRPNSVKNLQFRFWTFTSLV